MRPGTAKKAGRKAEPSSTAVDRGGLFRDDFAEVDALPVLVLEDADRDFGIMVRVEGHDSYLSVLQRYNLNFN